MLQELDFGKLDNQFHDIAPAAGDFVVCAQKNKLLVCLENDRLTLPTWEQVEAWSGNWTSWSDVPVKYAFSMQGANYFLWMGQAGEAADERFEYEPSSSFRLRVSLNIYFALMTGWHLYSWYRANQFCGCCGHPTVHDGKERMMRCPECGNMIFPKIAPAAIIALTHGDKLMLAQNINAKQIRYGLLAGFIEIGETAEEAVAREVMEEVGLKVKNIRYYKSQPWGIAGNLSIGYFCDLDGDEHVTLDRTELSLADWFDRDNLPIEDDGVSLTREMVRIFGEGKEPK